MNCRLCDSDIPVGTLHGIAIEEIPVCRDCWEEIEPTWVGKLGIAADGSPCTKLTGAFNLNIKEGHAFEWFDVVVLKKSTIPATQDKEKVG